MAKAKKEQLSFSKSKKIDLEYLQQEYDKLRRKYDSKAYLYISELFDSIRAKYRKQYLASPRAKQAVAEGRRPDPEQSWRAFKGKNFENLILYIIEKVIESIGLKTVKGDILNRRQLDKELSAVYRNLLVRFGEYSILPDADLVVYNPKTSNVAAIISVKITLRERIAQTAYWKLKLAQDPVTMNIKGLFVTTDEDGDLKQSLDPKSPTRNRIIVEHDLDGTYVLNEVSVSDKVKPFPELVEDLKKLVNGKK